MKTLTTTAAKKLGKRAAAYVEANLTSTTSGKTSLVPDAEGATRGIVRTLTRVYGSPQPVGYMSENLYWTIDSADLEEAS